VSPIYAPRAFRTRSADVLFFTSPMITRREFLSWSRLFEAVNLEVDYWDIERYEGISFDTKKQRHELSWIGRYVTATILDTLKYLLKYQ
jgi:hypothetical protein